MIYEKEINGVKFTLFCETWETHTSWGHKVTLYRNNTLTVGSYSVRYYNRTWESYQYQSAIRGLIYKTLQAIKKALKETFKKSNGYKVITKKRADDLLKYIRDNSEYRMYDQLYSMF